MKKIYGLFVLIFIIASCSPARLQSSRIIPSENVNVRYALSGYTDLGDIEPNSSIKYAEYSLSDACPFGIEIISVQEYSDYNGLGEFLRWEIVADCLE
tara:strand:- start:217 stop:510 length:294 start_codon:yes stop_codon:yes gene_type:complete